jgi:hypothetical protein
MRQSEGGIAMTENKRRGVHPIVDDTDVKAALAEVEALASQGTALSEEDRRHFDKLMDEIQLYQQMYCQNPFPTSGAMLRDLLSAAKSIRGTRLEDVALETGITVNDLQDLADEKRAITEKEKAALCTYFNVLPVAFRT